MRPCAAHGTYPRRLPNGAKRDMWRPMPSLSRPLLYLLAGLGVTAGAIVGTVSLFRSLPGGACQASAASAKGLQALAVGEVAAMKIEPKALPDLAFDGPDGQRVTLASFRGKAVLLNLWATWCEPCKREMPALDKVQAELGGQRFEVVAVNIDTRNLERPKAWLRDAGIAKLAYYADNKAQIFQDLKRIGEVEGLPTTLLVGPDGCKIGKLSGWAEWDSPDGIALMKAAVPKS